MKRRSSYFCFYRSSAASLRTATSAGTTPRRRCLQRTSSRTAHCNPRPRPIISVSSRPSAPDAGPQKAAHQSRTALSPYTPTKQSASPSRITRASPRATCSRSAAGQVTRETRSGRAAADLRRDHRSKGRRRKPHRRRRPHRLASLHPCRHRWYALAAHNRLRPHTTSLSPPTSCSKKRRTRPRWRLSRTSFSPPTKPSTVSSKHSLCSM